MTDATNMLQLLTEQIKQFNYAQSQMRLLADRIASDSTLSTQLYEAAQAGNRKDLAVADFDNFKVAVDMVTNMLNALTGASVPVDINTGGAVKLAFYKIV